MSALPNLFSALDGATESALRESIRRFGVLVPVVRDQHGRTLDGHHRSRIADEESVKYRVDLVTVTDDEEAREIAVTLNADRRQMDAEQRREVHVALARTGHSERAIAGATGFSKATVRRDIERAEIGSDEPIRPERIHRQGGGTYPAKRPTIVAAKDEREAERAQTALETAEVPAGRTLDVKRVERIAREQAADARRAEATEPTTASDDITVHHGDFREVLNDDYYRGTIITDPPYPREFLALWGDLASYGMEWECDALVAMSGQFLLPDVIKQIQRAGWTYRWTAAYLTAGPATRVHAVQVGTSWKPILIFDHDNTEREFVTTDVFRSTGDDKHHHHWGQNENGIAALVEAFTKPGDLVIDPFLGGGTTAVVCKALGRRFVGCDIDANAVHATRERLNAA
jgi:ParB-like chromosome segregation protein Spo0J